MAISLAPVELFLPIISFLFIFVVIYALLMKTGILGNNPFTAVFLSLFVSAFFIVNSQLVDFVQISIGWAVTFIVVLLLILLFVGLAGKDALKVITENKTVAWVLLAIIVLVFVVSSSYVFNWVINWELIQGWFDEDWFGVVVLLVLAGVVARVLTKK